MGEAVEISMNWATTHFLPIWLALELGEAVEISVNWATTHFFTYMVGLGTVMYLSLCHLACCCVTVSV